MELELVVAAVPAPRPQPCGRECCPEGGPERLVVHWEGWEAPEGEYSLPALLRRDLLHIRAEHAAWAYELGLLDAGGRSVQERLTGGAPLSLWWCSLLYERHPKMTPGLYEVYKLRALERFMDARGVTALRCSGGDARLRRVLEALCAAGDRSFAAAGPETDAAFAARPGLLRRCYAACPAPLRAAARYVHWWWTVRRLLPACPLPSAPPLGARPGRRPPSPPTSPMWIWRRPARGASAPATGRACTRPSTPRRRPRAGTLCAGCSSAFPRRSSACGSAWSCATASARAAGTAAASTTWRSCCGPATWSRRPGATSASAFLVCFWSAPCARPSTFRVRA
jgi:hypothetical protein